MADGAVGDTKQSKFELELADLMVEGRWLSPPDPKRRVVTNRVVRSIQRSGTLWRATGTDAQFYEDALMRTWEHFVLNLWEPVTVEQPYCHPDCKVMRRLNMYLRMRVQDLAVAAREETKQRVKPRRDRETGDVIDPIEQVPSPERSPQDVRSAIADWVEREQALQQVHVRGKPDVTVAWLIREYLLADRKWKDVSGICGVPISTLSSFYERECRPRLQDFCRDEGFV